MLPATGVLMQNRGVAFSLQRGALNTLSPGRLPVHTLNPALAVLKDGRVMAYGAMGGDGQPQSQAAIFTRYVHYGQPLADSIADPRFHHQWRPDTLSYEAGLPQNILDGLRARGHAMEQLSAAGSTQAIAAGPDGKLVGVAIAWRDVAAPALIKFLLTGSAACALCYLIAGVLLRVPAIARIV